MLRHTPLNLILFMTALGCTKAGAPGGTKGGLDFGEEVKVGKGAVVHEVLADGSLSSPSSKPLVVQRIRWYWDYNISWTAEEGTLVKAGDLVVKLDPATIQKDLTEKEMELEQSKLEMEEARLSADDDIADAKSAVTQSEFDLKKELLLLTDSDAVSESEKKKQKLKIEAAKATLRRNNEKVVSNRTRGERRVTVQSLKLKKVEEEVADMRSGLAKTELKAPQDGIVIFPLFSGNSGWQKARPGAGVQVNAVVAEVADPKDLVGKIFVPEIDAEGIVAGTPGVMTLDIAPGEEIPGKVRSVAGVPTTAAERDGNKSPKPADNVRQFEIVFVPDKLPPQGMPGMTVRVTLRPTEKADVLRVPAAALAESPPVTGKDGAVKGSPLQPGAARSGGETTAFVFTRRGKAAGAPADKGGGWAWKEVKLGAQSLSYAEVVGGLEEGDEVRTVNW